MKGDKNKLRKEPCLVHGVPWMEDEEEDVEVGAEEEHKADCN